MTINVTNQTFLLDKNTFRNNTNITSVDLCNVSYENNSMQSSFADCKNLYTVTNINHNITSLYGTFAGCNNMVKPPVIPNSVTTVGECFYTCYKLRNLPKLPNSVISMPWYAVSCSSIKEIPQIPPSITNIYCSFYGCTNLIKPPTIPNGVINMMYSFYECRNIENFPTIPNNVSDISYAFYNCHIPTTVSNIPDSIVNMSSAFEKCSNLETVPNLSKNVVSLVNSFKDTNISIAPRIYNKVTNMYGCFNNCLNLKGTIYIESENISNASLCFNGTTLTKNVCIPMQNNGVNTTTYNSFKAEGYTNNGSLCGVRLRDINQRYYTLKITTKPSDSTVSLSCGDFPVDGRKITVPSGSVVNYTVSREGYETYTNTALVNRADIIHVELEPL